MPNKNRDIHLRYNVRGVNNKNERDVRFNNQVNFQ